MPQYLALLYDTDDGDYSQPEYAEAAQTLLKEYEEFDRVASVASLGGAALYPTSFARTVRVKGGKGGEVVVSDGPFAETKEVLGGYYVLEAADLDAAVALAALIPAARTGCVEVRPIMQFGPDEGEPTGQ